MREEELLREKRRYGLEERISSKEKELLSLGVPIQKIIGFIDFDDLKIFVNRDVLIPRYETEEVVHEALKYIAKSSKVLDLCAGSGYIGLTVKQKTDADVTLSDISNEAIEQIKHNAKAHHLDVEIIKSDLFESIEGKYDVIISNPPYIPEGCILPKSVTKFEPSRALFAGIDGNDFYKQIIAKAEKYIKKPGVLILEISNHNEEFIRDIGFEIKNDINKKPRIAIKKFY